jgi:hypothetical protein
MPRTTIAKDLRFALAQAARDADYRAHIIEDGRTAQIEARLGEADWHVLLNTALALDADARLDPTQATEIDHGEYDAAGVKG